MRTRVHVIQGVGCKCPGTGSISGVSDFSEPEGWAVEGRRSRPRGGEHPTGGTAAPESCCNHEKVARLRDQVKSTATRDETLIRRELRDIGAPTQQFFVRAGILERF